MPANARAAYQGQPRSMARESAAANGMVRHRERGLRLETPVHGTDSSAGVPTVPLTAEQISLRAKIAANTRWSREDPAANAQRGQAGLRARFDREVREAEPGLSEAEYARRAESARKAHMARLALASSRVRARKGGGADAA